MSFERRSPRKPGSKPGAKWSKKTGGRKWSDRPESKTRSRTKSSRPGAKAEGRRPKEEFKKRPRIKMGPWADSAYSVTKAAEAPRPRKAAVETEAPETAQGAAPATTGERLQKVLARAGIASRRNAELLILEGAITVNGKLVTELGTRVDATHDKIKVHGKLIYTENEPTYLALYKPKGVISSLSDPEGRRHLGLLLRGVRERVIPVGRLDYNSEGLMLLTNDGTLAEKIIKARELPKIYMVKIKGHPDERDLDFLKRGFFTAEGVVRFASFGVEQTLKNKSWLKLEVTEGSKLDLRELLNHKGLLVDRIVRTAIGPITTKGLEPGEYRYLKRQDFEKLLSFANT